MDENRVGRVERGWSLQRECLGKVRGGSKGIEAMLEHLAREMVLYGAGLDAKVGEHGVRPPAAKDACGIRVDASAEERGGTVGAQAFDGEEEGINSCVLLDVGCTIPEAIGDMVVLHCAPGGEI